MFKTLCITAMLAAGVISMPSHASLVSTDWKTSGDALATLDSETGLEWLDLTVTRTKSISQVAALLDTTYAGWRFPTESEVYQLFGKTFTSYSFAKYSANTFSMTMATAGASEFIDMFGDTELEGGKLFSLGYFEKNGAAHAAGFAYWNYANTGTLVLGVQNEPDLISNSRASYYGVYLVSDGGTTLSSINDPSINANNPNAPVSAADVPVPVSMAAPGLLLLILGARRKSA